MSTPADQPQQGTASCWVRSTDPRAKGISREEPLASWITNRLAALARENFGIGDEIAMDRRGKFYRDLYWLVIIQGCKLQLCHLTFSSSVWFKHEIAINDHAHRKAWPDCQCRLDIQIAPDNLLASLIEGICGAQTERLENGCVV